MMTKVKTDAEIAALRTSGRMLATVLQTLRQQIQAGMSTADLARMAHEKLDELGGKPAFLGYQGFPDVICISVNDEVVHGIPSAKRYLKNGDVVGLDFGVNYKGMITDGAITVIVGNADSRVKQLVRDTEQAMLAGIETLHDGVRVGDIGAAVEQVLKRGGYGIVRDLVGHGVGHEIHEEPNIPNYGRAGSGPELKAGMTIAIEPMATLGTDDVVLDQDDGWTIMTRDGSLAAHFEHTVLITQDGYEILTTV